MICRRFQKSYQVTTQSGRVLGVHRTREGKFCGNVYDLRSTRRCASVNANGQERDRKQANHPDIRRVRLRCQPTGVSQSVLKVLQSLARCAVYGMLDGLSSNVSSGHNTKMYTTALGAPPICYMQFACHIPIGITHRVQGDVTVISCVRQPQAKFCKR